ncbi:MAG: cell envelope biogenesis protein TolA [Roseinatronobacter sp.]
MDTGQKVSGAVHLGLIAWIMVSDIFQAPDRTPAIPTTDVSLISADEFAALSNPRADPVEAPAPVTPPAPEPEAAPVSPSPAPEPEPATPEPPAPVSPPAPEPQPEPEPAAPVELSTGVIFSPLPAPGVSERPRPRPVDRVAPTPSEAPPETAQIDMTARPAAEPDAEAETPIPSEEQAEVAPPEATTEIVTEATDTDDTSIERAAMAPTLSQRPRTRPDRPVPAPPAPAPPAEAETVQAPAPPTPAPPPDEPMPEPAPEASPDDAIAEALAAALSQQLSGTGGSTSASSSASLSASEADSLRLAIQQCWNIGVLSTDAQQVTVTVAFSMTPSARHEQGTIRMVSASGGSDTAVQQAFEAARRAIIRCEGDGYGLPPEKYDAWRDIEITFNPEGMRLR